MTSFSGATWRKSLRSNGDYGQCVEVAAVAEVVGVRDSKRPDATVLAFRRAELGVLVEDIKAGRYDL